MSLWFPIMVNDKKIGRVCISRTQPLEKGRDEYMYDWEIELEAHGDRTAVMRMGRTKHNHSAGALALIQKVLTWAQVEMVS